MNTERLAALGAALQARAQWLAVAESCTGGLLAARLTDVPGASGWFDRGLVTYANRAKVALLGVPATLIETHGAVSAEVGWGRGIAPCQDGWMACKVDGEVVSPDLKSGENGVPLIPPSGKTSPQ